MVNMGPEYCGLYATRKKKRLCLKGKGLPIEYTVDCQSGH